MVKFQKKIETVTVKDFEVKSGVYFAKIDDDNGSRFYKFIVKDDDEYEAVIVVDDNYLKSIRYDSWETVTSWNFERIFSGDKETSFIEEAEFKAHFINVMASLSAL